MKKVFICSCIGVTMLLCIIFIWKTKGTKIERLDVSSSNIGFEEEFKDFVEYMEDDYSTNEVESESIYRPELDEWFLEADKKLQLFDKATEDCIVYEYRFRGDKSKTEIEVPEEFDYMSLQRALCAIEDFCGMDFRVTDTYYIGFAGMVQFEYDGQEYTCVSDGVTGKLKICDKVFEHD